MDRLSFLLLRTLLFFAASGGIASEIDTDALFDGRKPISDRFLMEEPVKKEVVRILNGHSDTVFTVAYSNDGSKIVTGAGDALTLIWDAASGKVVRELEDMTAWILGESGKVFKAALSPDGKTLVTSPPGKSVIWDIASGKRLGMVRVDRGRTPHISFNADGSQFAAVDHYVRWARIIETRSGKEIKRFHLGTTGAPAAFFSRDGKSLITLNTNAKAMQWDLESPWPFGGRQLAEFAKDAEINHAFVNPSRSRALISFTAKKNHQLWTELWDIESWTRIDTLKPTLELVQNAAFSPNGLDIAVRTVRGISVLDANTGVERYFLTSDEIVDDGLAYSPDGAYLAAGSRNQVLIWKVDRTAAEKAEYESRRAAQLSDFLSKPASEEIDEKQDGEKAQERFRLP